MARQSIPVTLDTVRATHDARRLAIRERLAEFAAIWATASDELLFEELVFCIFTAGASARMGLRSVEAVRPLLAHGTHDELTQVLLGRHRYPAARAGYIVTTREFLQDDCGLRLRARLDGFTDPLARRDWVARTKGIKGIGYKEASHFLRNIGLRGYAILDKHILRALHEVGILESPQPPANRARYLATEEKLRSFAITLGLDFDELDLVLWTMKTGEILK